MVDLRLGRILTRECKAIQLLTDMLCHSIFRYVYVQCFFFWHLNKLASGLYLGGVPSYSLSCDICYFESFYGFSQRLQANAGIVPQTRPQVPPSYPFK